MNPPPSAPSKPVNSTTAFKNPAAGKSRSAAAPVPPPRSGPKTAPASAAGAGNTGSATAPAQTKGRHEIIFRLDASPAREVLLAGNFTDWSKAPIPMRKNAEGAWQTKVLLAPGKYHYKFVVDGEWQNDPRAALHSPNPFGTSDNVLEVS